MKTILTKVIIFLLSVSVLISGVAVTAAQNVGGFEPGEYNKAISLLKDLSILDDTVYAKYDTSTVMTRGEFASLAIAVMGFSDESAQSEYIQKFSDVTPDNPFAKDINFAVSMGLFNGVSETSFAPDQLLTLNQVIKVCVTMLGYGDLAIYKGGYPAGYIKVANETGILKNVVTDSFENASRGNVIVLMCNTLFADFVSITGISGDSYSYEIKDGENLLSYYHKIYEGEGVVSANWEYALSGDALESDYIVINGKRYFTESARAIGSVGKNVKYYYKTIGSKDVIITMREENNNIVSIRADGGYTFDFNLGQYTVPTEKNDLKFNLYNYNVVYNRGGITGDTPVDFKKLLTPKIGTVTLIDNNDDKIYDVVIVEEPDVLLFKAYDQSNEKIYDMSDRSRDIALDDYKNYEIKQFGGGDVELSKLKSNTVVMVYKSYDKKSLKLLVCNETVQGTVSEIGDDKIVVNGEELSFSPVARLDGLRPGQTYKSVIYPGQSYKFYLDSYRGIVFHESAAKLKTGYILDIANVNSGLTKATDVQLATEDEEISVISLADTVKIETINGKSSYSVNEVKGVLADFATAMYGTINPKSRLFVQYSLNQNNEINHIMLPYVISSEEEYNNPPANYSFFKIDYILTRFEKSGTYVTNSPSGKEFYRLAFLPENMSAGLTMSMDDLCSIFYVPEFSNISFAENQVSVKDLGSLQKNDLIRYYPTFDGTNDQIEVYSTDREVRLVNAIVWIKENGVSTQIVNGTEDSAIVKAVSTVSSEDGDALVKIDVIQKRTEKTLYSDNLNILNRSVFADTALTGFDSITVLPSLSAGKNKIVPGDIIRYSVSGDGYVDDIALMYDSENNNIVYRNASAFTKTKVQYRHTCGEVTDVYGKFAVLNVYDASVSEKVPEPHVISAYPRIYVYDYNLKEIRMGSASDIAIGDKVFLCMYYTSSRDGEIFVFKGGKK